MNVIYTVGCLDYPEEHQRQRSRVWGWFSDRSVAEQVILQNDADIFEMGYYTFAVIERVVEGITGSGHSDDDVWWYEAVYDPETRETSVKRIPRPEWAAGICAWTMG